MPGPMPPMLAQWYDSTRQRMHLTGSDDSEDQSSPESWSSTPLAPATLGQLRWDAIRSSSRLQTHTQLLDGALFQSFASPQAIDRLGLVIGNDTLFPFTVTVAGESLETSLVDMVCRGFLFSSVCAPYWQRYELLGALEQLAVPETVDRYVTRHGAVDGMVGLIHDTGLLPDSEWKRLQRCWRFWIDAENDGRLKTCPQSPYTHDEQAMAQEGLNELTLLTRSGEEARRRILSPATLDPRTGSRRRSLVWRELAPLDRSALPDEKSDARTLRNAFDRCYYRNIAISENAMLSSEDDAALRGVRRRAAVKHAQENRTVVFPDNYRLRLGELGSRQWRDLIVDVEHELHAWWNEWDTDALEVIGKRLESVSLPIKPAPKPAVTAFVSTASSVAGSFAGVGTTGLAVGGAIGVATWILEGPVNEKASAYLQRRNFRYDVVEVLPTENP